VDDPQLERAPIASFVDIAALIGLAGIVGGAVLLGPTDLGFDRAKAVTALFSWIPVTLGPGLLVLAVTALEIAAGAVLARAIRRRAFERLDELLLQGFAFAVVKDVLLLGILGGFGLFSQPILGLLDVAIVAGGALLLRPLIDPAAVARRPAVTPFGVLLLAAWAAPVLLQLASPVVPFLDILPNHVAPAEHLRTFGTLTHLTDTQSPIYGPSRIFLGYTALLGAITTTAGLPAGQALAGFILPSTILVAIAIRRLAIAVGGATLVPWALLTFAMTTSVARLGDARATVIVLPLVAWVLAILAEELAASRDRSAAADTNPGSADAGPPALLPPSVAIGLGLGAAMLVHPVIGFLAGASVVIVVLLRPRVARLAIPALATGAIVAVPQAATMIGVVLPPSALVLAIVLGIGAGLVLARDALAGARDGLVLIGRVAAVASALGAIFLADPLIRAAIAGAEPLLKVLELTIVAAIAAIALRATAARSPVLWAALAAGFGVAMLTQLVPEKGSGLLGDALRFELPKTLQYWVPVFAALLAAAGLDALARWDRLAVAARGVALVAFVGAAALPIRSTPIDAYHLGEHRLSETFSIAMRWVQTGFWSGFPDSRYVVDGPRQELLDAVRREIAAGRIGPDTPILHVAGSFQQWVATPLGVFDGVTETDVVPDAELSIHTVGGRLHGLDELEGLLSSGRYPYLLYEPSPEALPAGTEDAIAAAGYVPISSNGQGTLYRLGT
jgi:hypothetical protein